ncbi:MAG: asparagine synthase B [Planctomycetota bacterium]|nr:MAG: asparagine synthase B [Planctomycetota bacterium]
MCSITAIFGIDDDPVGLRTRAVRLSARLRHRGPDWSGVWADEHAVLAHERLAIVDPTSGSQPLIDASGELVLAVNGEIYNHAELRERCQDYPFATASDCEVILPLFAELGPELLHELSGIFAFVLYDRGSQRWLVARDPIGVIPLYYGFDERGRLHVASELKALVDVCPRLHEFPPGHWMTPDSDGPVRYFEPAWRDYAAVQGVALDADALRESLCDAVRRQLMSDVPYGVLLSGGLDSSLVAAIAARYAGQRVEDQGSSPAHWPRLHSFAIGLEGSPDLAAARVVADALDSVHHAVTYSVQEGLDVLPDVIRHIESYDVTSIRASTPMFLLARYVKASGVKMVLSGEGADEIFGGYLYFHMAPDARAFHEETVRKLAALHQFDCLRANKSMAAWGVEARVPFLDRHFLDVAMAFDAEHKLIRDGRMEKHVLRAAFEGWLPESVLWRQKEQFSDGVGYAWIDSLRAHAEASVSDKDLSTAAFRFPVNPPATKEAYLYRALFAEAFPGDAAAELVPGGKSIACSSPAALAWDPSFAASADPSGRAVAGVHDDAYVSGAEGTEDAAEPDAKHRA